MLVREVMTSPALTIGEEDDVTVATALLDRAAVTSLPVVDRAGCLIGVLGEADVIRALADPSSYAADGEPRVRDLMTREVVTASADDELDVAVALMAGAALKSLPVLLHGRVLGVLSRRDVIRLLARGDLRSPAAVYG